MNKKVLMGALFFSIAFSAMVPNNVNAQEVKNESLLSEDNEKNIIASGKCGENVYWELSDSKELTISGEGEMWAMENKTTYPRVNDGVACPYLSYRGEIESLVIEDGVTCVNAGTFLGCENLKQVTLPESVTRIAKYAFANCISLKDINLPNQLVTLESGAFYECAALTEITIPSSLNIFERSVFYKCSSLKIAYIKGDENKDIREFVRSGNFFDRCSSLERIEVDESNVYFKDIDGVLYSKDGRVLIEYPGGRKEPIYEIVEGTYWLSLYALDYNGYIEEIKIPATVGEIWDGNFEYLTNLKSLTIPNTIKSSQAVGEGCVSLDKINNESDIDIAVGSETGYYWIDKDNLQTGKIAPNSTVYHRAVVVDVDIPEYIEIAVGTNQEFLCKAVYYDDENILVQKTDVKFSSSDDTILSIDENGMMTSKKVGTVEITVEPVYKTASWRGGIMTCQVAVKEEEEMSCIVVDNVKFNFNSDGTATLTDGRFAPSNYIIPEKVRCGGKYYTVTAIDKWAFSWHEGLQSIVIADTITEISGDEAVGAFYSCKNLQKVVLSKNLKEIGEYTFSHCINLTEINLPDTLVTIREEAFSLTSIASIDIPASVKKIEKNVFRRTNLKNFYLPATVTDFDKLALAEISSLECITVEEGQNEYMSKDGVLYEKGDNGFGLCLYPALKKSEIYEIDSRATAVYAESLDNVKLDKLIFPADMRGEDIASLGDVEIVEFAVAEGSKYLVAKDGVLYSKDGKNMYLYPSAKKDKIFFIPKGVENVGNFRSCMYLEEIYVPASVKMFEGATNSESLKKLVFSTESQIQELNEHNFIGCKKLVNVYLPRTLRTFSGIWYGNVALSNYLLTSLYIAEDAPFYSEGKWGLDILNGLDLLTIYGHGSDNKLSELAEELRCEYLDVSKGYDDVLGITFKDTSILMQVGKSRNVDAVVYPEVSKSCDLVYKSSNEAVAKVSENGTVTAVAPGVCYITAITTNGSGEYARCQIEVGAEGLYKDADGKWNYYTNGKIDTEFTGLVKYKTNWVYVVKGRLNSSYTGLVKYKTNWVYVNKGKLDATYTGLVKYKSNWVYVKKGKLDATYTGLVKYKTNWVYVSKGKLNATYTGLVKYKSNWVYVAKGKLDASFTGMAKNQYGWWYVTKGKLDLAFTGIAKNAYGTWYLQNGKLDLTFSGKVNVNGKQYTVKKGKLIK